MENQTNKIHQGPKYDFVGHDILVGPKKQIQDKNRNLYKILIILHQWAIITNLLSSIGQNLLRHKGIQQGLKYKIQGPPFIHVLSFLSCNRVYILCRYLVKFLNANLGAVTFHFLKVTVNVFYWADGGAYLCQFVSYISNMYST